MGVAASNLINHFSGAKAGRFISRREKAANGINETPTGLVPWPDGRVLRETLAPLPACGNY